MEVRGSCPGCPGWVLCGKGRSPFVRFKGVGGLGWLMFEEMFGASMDLYVSDFSLYCKGVGRFRWLMFDEMLGSFILLFGSPG